MQTDGAVLAALGAAGGFAASAVLQQRAARTMPEEESLQLRLLVDLAHRPLWLMGVASMVVAYGLEALALGLSSVALVEPIVVCELLFAVPIGARLKGVRIGAREWAGTLSCAGGIALFLAVADPRGHSALPSLAGWLAVGAPCAGVALLLLIVARGPESPRRAALLGLASGICFGLLAVLTKTSITLLLRHGPVGLLTRFEPYALITLGVGGFLLSQSAYQAAPLASSLPIIDTSEPVLAVILGASVLGERVTLDPSALCLECVGALIAIGGVFLLGRSPVVLATYARVEAAKGANDDEALARPTPP